MALGSVALTGDCSRIRCSISRLVGGSSGNLLGTLIDCVVKFQRVWYEVKFRYRGLGASVAFVGEDAVSSSSPDDVMDIDDIDRATAPPFVGGAVAACSDVL